jgi:hypothetical protein
MNDTPTSSADSLSELNKLLVKVLRELAASGHQEEACRFAAQAWSLLRHDAPREAERHNGLLHYLTAPAKSGRQA